MALELASVLAVAEALGVASALLGAAPPPSNTAPPPPPAGRATSTEVLLLPTLSSTLSQALCLAAWSIFRLLLFSCFPLLLVLELELKLLSNFILLLPIPAPPELPLLTIRRSLFGFYCRKRQLPLGVHWPRDFPSSECGFLSCSNHVTQVT